MTKQEAQEFLKEKSSQGYITHSTLLDMWEDNDEIPNNVVPWLYNKPRAKTINIITSKVGLEYFNSALDEYVQRYVQPNIKVKIKEQNEVTD